MGWIQRAVQLAAAAGAAGSIAVSAQSAPVANEAPGSLLYSTHCIGCHTTQVHWRDGRRVTDWASLNAQVRRWQDNSGLRWTDDDIIAVARHLNAVYYRFPVADPRAEGDGRALRAAAPPR
jgi:hypothetical protein